MYATNATYHPIQDGDHLYAVYSNGSIWTSYPACGEGIEVVGWTTDGLIVETYNSLGGAPTLNGHTGTANADGTYTLPFDVESNPCMPLHIQWGSTSQIVKTPLIINTYTRTSAVMSAVGDCSDCDMIVMTGGTAIVNRTPQTVRDITVYPGGRLTIEEGKTLNASSLTMRADGDDRMPTALIMGTLNCPTLYHDRRIDNSRYYWIALPYDVTIADINYADEPANGKNAVYDTDYYIQYYDGIKRATDKGASSTYWTHIGDITDESYQSKTTLKAGRGYLLALPRRKQNETGHTYRTLRFPMTVADWSGETSVVKTVAAAGKSCDWPQHVGWNLIGNPFLQNYSAVNATGLVCGRLIEHYNAEGVPEEPWYELEEEVEPVPYITIFDPNSNSYTQTRLFGQNIPPFSAAFVQLADGKTGLQFDGTDMNSLSSAPARRMGLLNEEEQRNSEFEVEAVGYNNEDHFTIILDDKYSTAYEVAADLMKMHNQDQTNIYTHHNGIDCVFDAISYADGDSIPVGLEMPTDGDILIRLGKHKLTEDIVHIWLVDEVMFTQTDLLRDNYALHSEAGTYNNRLWLRIEKRTDTTTDIETTYNIGNKPYKFLKDGQLNIQRGEQIYDATGIRVR